MKKVAIITNGIVSNVAITDTYMEPDWVDLSGLVPEPTIGWTYENDIFTAPPVVVQEPVQLPRHISVGAFFDRFGDQKYPILSSADAGVKALIQDVSVRKYIDLDNSQLPYGLAMLVAAGFTINPTVIVDAEILEAERP